MLSHNINDRVPELKNENNLNANHKKKNTKIVTTKYSKNFLLFLTIIIILSLQKTQAQIENNNSSNGENATNGGAKCPKNLEKNNKPNIVIILIDDMGFNDVSFHGSNQIITPNIDALAYNGIILNNLYMPNLCTPSRATLLTGKYPIHTGTQHQVCINDEPWGLPLKERLMPEIFRENGYTTNLVGKWHLGFWKKEMTPTMRGFDYHYGYYSGYIDYYNYMFYMKDYAPGYDLRRNLETSYEANGTYATEEFTREAVRVIKEHDTSCPLFLVLNHLAVHTGNENNPMQAPKEEVEKFKHISDEKRRIYAGMVSVLDRGIGETIKALTDKGILNNTIVLLYSDNGAPTVGEFANLGSNYPFRGQKQSPWEGGIRSAGLIYSPLLKRQNYVSNQVMHAVDWFPTLAEAAGIKIPKDIKLDGFSQWDALNQQLEPKPRTLLHALDDVYGYFSYTRDNYKIVNGSTFDGQYDTWLGELSRSQIEDDPLSAYYVQTVLSSPVHKSLESLKSSLNIGSVEKLRAEATNRCPPSKRDSDDEIYHCDPFKAPCLYNIAEDPCEIYNLAKFKPDIVTSLIADVNAFRKTAEKPARVQISDPNCDPAIHNGTWNWWAYLYEENAVNHSAANAPLTTRIWRGLYAILRRKFL